MTSSKTSNRPHSFEPVRDHSTAHLQLTFLWCFTFVAMHKLKEKILHTQQICQSVSHADAFSPTRLLGSPSRTRREQMQINDADERSLAKLYKMQNLPPPVSRTQTKQKEKQTDPRRQSQRAKTQKKRREANGFVLHLAWSRSAETSRAQIDFLLFERNMIYFRWKPKSLALTLSCSGESFGWWKSK